MFHKPTKKIQLIFYLTESNTYRLHLLFQVIWKLFIHLLAVIHPPGSGSDKKAGLVFNIMSFKIPPKKSFYDVHSKVLEPEPWVLWSEICREPRSVSSWSRSRIDELPFKIQPHSVYTQFSRIGKVWFYIPQRTSDDLIPIFRWSLVWQWPFLVMN